MVFGMYFAICGLEPWSPEFSLENATIVMAVSSLILLDILRLKFYFDGYFSFSGWVAGNGGKNELLFEAYNTMSGCQVSVETFAL